MFEIQFAAEAHDDLKALRKLDQVQVVTGIENQLTYEPHHETVNRKKLRPNKLADWELRVGKCRVFYNVDEEGSAVIIEAIGLKIGNKLYIRGREKKL